MPKNGIILHTSDAKKLGVKSGDQVRVVSATNPEGVWDLGNGTTKAMIGKVQVTETIRPGVVTAAGRWRPCQRRHVGRSASEEHLHDRQGRRQRVFLRHQGEADQNLIVFIHPQTKNGLPAGSPFFVCIVSRKNCTSSPCAKKTSGRFQGMLCSAKPRQ
jgi:anaerobic selenocysteine-containing dehydrogenase